MYNSCVVIIFECVKDRKHGYGTWTLCPESELVGIINTAMRDATCPTPEISPSKHRFLPPLVCAPSVQKNFFHDRCFYEGNFSNDLCSGKGKMVYKGGAVYEGYWKKGKWSGMGVLEYSSNHVFKGEFIDGERKDGIGELNMVI